MRNVVLGFVLGLLLVPASSFAQETPDTQTATPIADAAADAAQAVAAQQPAGAPPPPVAVEYSRGYEIRRKIHVYSSFATLPLFGAEIALGQKLYNGRTSEGARSAHGAVAGGIAALFAVNTVTGAWNMWEARKDPHSRTKRIVHGLMMLGADAGFVLTGALAPDDDEFEGGGGGNRSLHRNVALTSIGVATASYIIMLVNR